LRRSEFQPKSDARYRTIPQSRIVELLLLVSWASEVDDGERRAAQAATSAALETWVGGGLGYRLSAEGERLFDPVEVVNFLKWAGLAGRDRYWEDHFVATHRRFVKEFRSEERDGTWSRIAAPRRFRVKLRRSFDLQGFAQGATVRLRLPLPLAGSYLDDVLVTPVLPDAVKHDAVLRDQCLDLRLKVSEDRMITIGADVLFTAHDPVGRSAPLTAQEAELYLRKSEGLIRVTPRIEALAAELSRGSSSARSAVEAFWAYMMGTLCSGMVRYGAVPADAPSDWVLDHGWYDCQLGAALLVSLCRARGIPARIVSGQCLYRLQPISHYWSEIWLDEAGWCPFDVICWDLSRGGQDRAWRDAFAGRSDYRLVTQCFPLVFTGPMSLRFPPAWHMVQVAADGGGAGGGVDTTYTNAEDGSLIYRDRVEVQDLGSIPDGAVIQTRTTSPYHCLHAENM
jgi:transglutaminase-like putative cysteine protease